MAPEGSITSVLYLHPKNGNYEAILEFMEKEKVLEKSRENGGFLGGSHNIPTSRQGPMLVLATWRAEADYRRWLASPVRADLSPILAPLLDRQSGGGETYVVARDLHA
ncbi:MAG TPA: hypothetical protein VFB69_05960 [Candidatus Dormibacteraeota bacterium]|nr:hypothetical protein [Candidatus Dormibacteraeota bacterium]